MFISQDLNQITRITIYTIGSEIMQKSIKTRASVMKSEFKKKRIENVMTVKIIKYQ